MTGITFTFGGLKITANAEVETPPAALLPQQRHQASCPAPSSAASLAGMR
jgi:hypothetical protein